MGGGARGRAHSKLGTHHASYSHAILLGHEKSNVRGLMYQKRKRTFWREEARISKRKMGVNSSKTGS